MAIADKSPTVEYAYDVDPDWFSKASSGHLRDAEGYDSNGYDVHGRDRAGFTVLDYENSIPDEDGDPCHVLYERVFSEWSGVDVASLIKSSVDIKTPVIPNVDGFAAFERVIKKLQKDNPLSHFDEVGILLANEMKDELKNLSIAVDGLSDEEIVDLDIYDFPVLYRAVGWFEGYMNTVIDEETYKKTIEKMRSIFIGVIEKNNDFKM